MPRTLVAQRLTQREQVRLVSQRPLALTPQCADGTHHLSCERRRPDQRRLVRCECVCHALVVHSNGTSV